MSLEAHVELLGIPHQKPLNTNKHPARQCVCEAIRKESHRQEHEVAVFPKGFVAKGSLSFFSFWASHPKATLSSSEARRRTFIGSHRRAGVRLRSLFKSKPPSKEHQQTEILRY